MTIEELEIALRKEREERLRLEDVVRDLKARLDEVDSWYTRFKTAATYITWRRLMNRTDESKARQR